MAQITLNSSGVASNGTLALQSNGTTTAVTIDASQNVGIGTASPSVSLHVSNATDNVAKIRLSRGTSSQNYLQLQMSGGDSAIVASGITGVNGSLLFGRDANTGTFTESARFDASGNLLVGATAAISDERLHVRATTTTGFAFRLYNTQATAGSTFGQYILYSGSSPNGTGNQFLRCDDSTTTRAEIRSNGGIGNYSANNVNLSDERTKTDIQNAGGYLTKICAIPVRTFKYKDQTDDLLNLGVIAQEVEAVAPELVDVSGFGETPEDGVPLKAIYQTDLQYALMKSIQELKALVDTQASTITQLQADVAALKGTA